MALSELEVGIANQSLGKIGAKQFVYGDITSFQSVQSLLYYEQTRDSLLRSFEWSFAKTRLRLVSSWLTDTTYTTDQYVWQSGLLYKCVVAHTSGTFLTDLNAAKWTLQSTVSAWTTTPTTYVVGELVTTNALLYKCLIAHTGGTFATDLAAGKWELSTTKPVNVFGYNYSLPATCLRLVKVIEEDVEYFDWELETNTILTDEVELDIVYINKITDTTKWSSAFKEVMISRLALALLNPMTGVGQGSVGIRELLLKELHQLLRQSRVIDRQEGFRAGNSDWNNSRY